VSAPKGEEGRQGVVLVVVVVVDDVVVVGRISGVEGWKARQIREAQMTE
jgi:hypothetical protein